MKKILFILLFSCISIFGYSQVINYDEYISIVTNEIVQTNTNIKDLKTILKTNPNDVETHKELVRQQTSLSLLKDKLKTVKNAVKLNKKLTNYNNKLDKIKTQLLYIKQQSEDADKKMINLFK